MSFISTLVSILTWQFLSLLFLIGLVTYVLFVGFSAIVSPLRSIPGPFLTRFTRLWYLRRTRLGHFHEDNIELHRKYGSIVRIAPNQYSIDDPDAIRTIYGHGTQFTKADWYKASSSADPTVHDLFTEQDTRIHAGLRRKVANLYSTSALVKLESHVDECISLLFERFSEIAEEGRPIDLQFWMQCYAFDVIGSITCDERFGFLDTGEDPAGLFGNLHRYLAYAASVGIMHELHRVLFPMFLMTGSGGLVHMRNFTQEQISKAKVRFQRDDKQTKGDFLSRMIKMNDDNPEEFTGRDLFMTAISNFGAGSDTTSISLCAVLYSLMTSPHALAKLRNEVKAVGGDKVIDYQTAQKMPYLQACIKEAMRLHPATGLPLSRVVPKQGAFIAGQNFPGGATVGVNTWVAHRNTTVFGHDAEQFRPERWLEASKERLSRMEEYYLPFGHGSRTCIGKNISLLEMSKLIPRLVTKFDLRLLDGKATLETQNVWFVKQINLICQVAKP
ncbi:cytochrome P450 [Paraphoma chrysanthemicola]|uniref:Cytochrome P450 n=1 Tax=Paraphoma chrysanthemicola TaxID=798071 RepID=A0A8K0RIP9_9PLEO|nr:cytochrome P450 [Paraphoma chrysanthemicola]